MPFKKLDVAQHKQKIWLIGVLFFLLLLYGASYWLVGLYKNSEIGKFNRTFENIYQPLNEKKVSLFFHKKRAVSILLLSVSPTGGQSNIESMQLLTLTPKQPKQLVDVPTNVLNQLEDSLPSITVDNDATDIEVLLPVVEKSVQAPIDYFIQVNRPALEELAQELNIDTNLDTLPLLVAITKEAIYLEKGPRLNDILQQISQHVRTNLKLEDLADLYLEYE